MRWCKAGLLCLTVMAVLVAAGTAQAAPLPFVDGLESSALSSYPSSHGWITLSAGKSGYVSNLAAYGGVKSFRLDSWPWAVRTDYVRLDVVPDTVSYEAAVYVDPSRGKVGLAGFVIGPGAMANYFQVDARTRRVGFVGASSIDLGAYTPGTWCMVHADLDFKLLKGDLYVNGGLAAADVGIGPKGTVKTWGVSSPTTPINGSFMGNVVYFDDVLIEEWVKVIPVTVDIKPGVYPNVINLGSHGVVPVAVLSDAEFDATQIDPATVSVGGAPIAMRGKQRSKAMAHGEDVNGDGLVDLLIQIETQTLTVPEDGYILVTGSLFDGTEFEGGDDVVLVP